MKLGILEFYRKYQRLEARVFTFAVRREFAQFGKNSILLPPFRCGGESLIEVGDDVYIGSHSWIQVIETPTTCDSPVISIGNGTAMSGNCTITASTSVVIEEQVLIGKYVHISDHAHAFSSSEIPIMDQGVTTGAPVRIGKGAWLGNGVVVCPGVRIGRNCVVGANSVVRCDIPDYWLAAGAPAKLIREIKV